MKKIRNFLAFLVILFIVGCGADINYEYQVDTEKQSIDLVATSKVDESDYKEIDGGKKKVLSIINEYKPSHYKFIGENDNEFKFVISFSSYKDYLTKYEEMFGKKSTSIFEVNDYSKESPFLANNKIILNDDMSGAFDWLKNALIQTGSVKKENEDNIINSESTLYSFNNGESNSIDNSFEHKEYIKIDDIFVSILLKQKQMIDFELSFNVDELDNKNLYNNLNEYLKEKKIDAEISTDNVDGSDKKLIRYKVDLTDFKLTNKNINNLNTTLGDGFIILESSKVKDDHFFSYDINQSTIINTNMDNLFNINEPMKVNFNIDKENLKVDSQSAIKMPYSSNDNLEDIEFNTYYNVLKVNVIIMVIAIIVIMTTLIVYLYKKNKINKNKIKTYIRDMKRFIKDHSLKNTRDDLVVENDLIIDDGLIINIKTIDKVDIVNGLQIKNILNKVILITIICLVIHALSFKYIVVLILVVSLIFLIIYLNKNYGKVLRIILMSGKEYVFRFTDNEVLENNYNKLLDVFEHPSGTEENK